MKERHVPVKSDGLVMKILLITIYKTKNLKKAGASKYSYAYDANTGICRLRILGILHRWTGLVLDL